MLLGIFYLLK